MPLPRRLLLLPLLTGLLLPAACGSLTPGFQQPQISVTSFALAPQSTSLAPHFNIGLRVTNPNRVPLPLRGISYEVEVEGNRILNGANPTLPTVGAYSSADFVIEAAPDLFGGARLLADLMTRQRSSLGFTFRARIDTGSLLPAIRVEEKGNFSLSVPDAR
jgi:LEA14-like dessication related protein